jgi:ankyrin repeat protein
MHLSLPHPAVNKGAPRVVEMFIEEGADVEASDVDGLSPLQMAVFSPNEGPQECGIALVKAGANPSAFEQGARSSSERWTVGGTRWWRP